jgi:hypothetical protein
MANAALKQSSKSSLKALDLKKTPPRSPRDTVGGFVIAARAIDKCRAGVAGSIGEYHTGCPLDMMFLDFAGIKYDDFKAKIAEGATDEEMDQWIREKSKRQPLEIIKWNNDLRYKRISEMNDRMQEFMETYIPENLPKGKIVYHFFDVYDIEEKRI